MRVNCKYYKLGMTTARCAQPRAPTSQLGRIFGTQANGTNKAIEIVKDFPCEDKQAGKAPIAWSSVCTSCLVNRTPRVHPTNSVGVLLRL